MFQKNSRGHYLFFKGLTIDIIVFRQKENYILIRMLLLTFCNIKIFGFKFSNILTIHKNTNNVTTNHSDYPENYPEFL